MNHLPPEEIAAIRSALEFDRDRVGAPGCDIRKRAAWLIGLLDAREHALGQRGEDQWLGEYHRPTVEAVCEKIATMRDEWRASGQREITRSLADGLISSVSCEMANNSLRSALTAGEIREAIVSMCYAGDGDDP